VKHWFSKFAASNGSTCTAYFAAQLRLEIKSTELSKFRHELASRARVLKRLGHIDEDQVVQLKGRAACEVDTADELLVTELMFNGGALHVEFI
jgi:superfamily II RNA helicase